MVRKICNSFLLLLLAATPLCAQEEDHAQEIESAEASDKEQDPEQLQLQLQEWKRHPVQLNKAGSEALLQLPGVNPLQVAQFIRYRNLLGPLIHLDELQAVPGWDVSTVKRVLPYCTVGEAVLPRRSDFQNASHFILLRWAWNTPFSSTAGNDWAGSSDALLFRYRFRTEPGLRLGITGEKDAGEPFLKNGYRKGFDHYGFYAYMEKIGRLRGIAVGDFTVNIGQGLISWQAFGGGKSADALAIHRQGPLLAPYSGSGEYTGYRGGGMSFRKNRLEATLFYSNKKFSAHVRYDSISARSTIQTLQLSGLHRTASEMAGRNRQQQTVLGAVVTRSLLHGQFHVATIHYRYRIPWQKELGEGWPSPSFGKSLSNMSVGYRNTWQNLHFFAEAAAGSRGGQAICVGILLAADPKLDIAFHFRHFGRHFLSPAGNAFREGAAGAAETGWYGGLVWQPAVAWRIDAYVDHFRFPYPAMGAGVAASGRDLLFQVLFKPTKTIMLTSRFKQENKWKTGDGGFNAPSWQLSVVQRFRLHAEIQSFSKQLWAARAEWVRSGNEYGALIYIESMFPYGRKLYFKLRTQYFATESWNTRIYVYEQDLRYAGSARAFSGRGYRYYITGQYKGWKGMVAGLRCGVWGAGNHLPRVVTGEDWEVKMQVQLEF